MAIFEQHLEGCTSIAFHLASGAGILSSRILTSFFFGSEVDQKNWKLFNTISMCPGRCLARTKYSLRSTAVPSCPSRRRHTFSKAFLSFLIYRLCVDHLTRCRTPFGECAALCTSPTQKNSLAGKFDDWIQNLASWSIFWGMLRSISLSLIIDEPLVRPIYISAPVVLFPKPRSRSIAFRHSTLPWQ